jgi:hypothetical protein
MPYINERDDNIEYKIYNDGLHITVVALFKAGDPYVMKCKGKSKTTSRETLLYYLFKIGNNFDRRFELCILEAKNRLIEDYRNREGLSGLNLDIKLTNKLSDDRLKKYMLE